MWPNARIGVMGPEQAAAVLISVKNDQLARAGIPPLDEESQKAIREPIMMAGELQGSAMYSTANIWDDGIIDPAQTRDVLGLGLSAAFNAPLRTGAPGRGIYRM
jgi:3-methylcrotonyl-CoA carboxylase beta subunit